MPGRVRCGAAGAGQVTVLGLEAGTIAAGVSMTAVSMTAVSITGVNMTRAFSSAGGILCCSVS